MMDDYLREIKTLADPLKEVNSSLSQEDMVAYALMGLPRDYEAAIITNIATGRDPVTFEDLRTKLIHQEHSLKQLNSDDSLSAATACHVHTIPASPRGGRGYGGSRGHGRFRGSHLGRGGGGLPVWLW